MTNRRPGKPLLEDPIWLELLERYVRGETAAALALEYKVSISAISWQARNRGYRKMDRPDAVYCWRQPPPIAAHGDRVEDLGFEFDDENPEASAAAALAQARRAAQEGRIEDHLRLQQAARSALRTARALRMMQGGGSGGRSHPAGVAGLPSPEGEGEVADVELRTAQRPPEGAWRTWLFLGGRGAGKTLAGASWISDMSEHNGRLALIGPTLHDVREVMIGGPSGVLSLARWRRRDDWPVYQASRRRLVFPSGAEAFVFSAEDPDSLRGPQFGAAWADEFCAWRAGGDTLALLRMGLRLAGSGAPGANARLAEPRCSSALDERRAEGAGEAVMTPRLMISTTPRPTAALKALRAEASCRETHATTRENAEHLSAGFVEELETLYGGTRRAAQELEGRVVEPEGGLFTAAMMLAARAEAGPARFDRVVVGVDPTATRGGDACGIVAVGRSRLRGNDDVPTAWVLADRSAAGLSPQAWGRRVLETAAMTGARAIVAEVNQGGEMVRAVLDSVGLKATGLAYRAVRAREGKRARAEPVAALYEQGRVRHLGDLGLLEEQLMALGVEGAEGDAGGDDRADALVWAVTDLMLGAQRPGPRITTLDSWATPRPGVISGLNAGWR